MKIGVLIPIYNEAKNIGALVKGLKQAGLEVYVIDDGSTDQSGLIAGNCGAIVIRNDEKRGKGFSLQRGFEYLSHHDLDGVITMDGDGQHAVSDVQKFIQKASADPDCIVSGNRMTDHKDMPFVRYLTNRFMSALISLACRQSVPDTQCGFRYIGSKVLRNISFKCHDFEIETEMLMKAAKKGFKIYSVPIQTIYNDSESYIHPVKDTVRFFSYFFREVFSK